MWNYVIKGISNTQQAGYIQVSRTATCHRSKKYCIYKWRPPVNLNTLQLLGANISYPEIIQNKDSYGDDGDSIFTYFWNIFIHPWVKLWKTIRHTGQRSWHHMKRSWQWGGMRQKIRSRANMKTAMTLLWKWNKNRNISLWWASTPSLPVCILGSFSNRTVEIMLWYITLYYLCFVPVAFEKMTLMPSIWAFTCIAPALRV